MTDKKYEKERDSNLPDARDENPDPITGEHGSHPVGVAAGGAGGAATGVVVGGAVGGPIGAVVGGAAGAVAGAAAGKAAAEAVNPTIEEEYWRDNYRTRPYYREGTEYSDYAPAYKYGWESASRSDFRNRRFEDVESHLQKEWESGTANRGSWSDIREVSRDAYNRTSNRLSERVDDRTSSPVWNKVEGNWKQFKGLLKEKWNQLTDDEIEAMEGRRERIIGKIQERYGRERWNETAIEQELSSLDRSSR
jgi:uncharacterized protein YjbJ (UPF0337 family)